MKRLGLEAPGSAEEISLRSRAVTGGCGIRSTFAAAFLAAVVGAVLFAPAVLAADREVLVVDTAYEPSLTRIQAGDTVVWRWASQNVSPHTVTAVNASFDSDRECGDPAACRARGNTFAWQFTQPGIYAYRCKVHAVMLGRVEVAEAPPPQPPPQPPSAGAGASPPPGGGQQRPQAGPAKPAPPAPPQQQATGPPPPRPRMAAVPGMAFSRAPVAAPAPRGIAPAVAPPRDPLSVLPEARPPEGSPEPPAEPPVQLAVEVPATQSESRSGLVVGIAVATLLATAGVFSKVVLFGPPGS